MKSLKNLKLQIEEIKSKIDINKDEDPKDKSINENLDSIKEDNKPDEDSFSKCEESKLLENASLL